MSSLAANIIIQPKRVNTMVKSFDHDDKELLSDLKEVLPEFLTSDDEEMIQRVLNDLEKLPNEAKEDFIFGKTLPESDEDKLSALNITLTPAPQLPWPTLFDEKDEVSSPGIMGVPPLPIKNGISKIDYFKARRRLILLSFTCRPCKSSESATDENAATDEHDQSTTLDHLLEAPETSTVSADVLSESIDGTLHSTMINSPVQDVTHAVTFNHDFSTGTSVDSVISVATDSISASVPAANVTYIIEPADDSDDAMDTLPFDVTRDGPVDTTAYLETSIGEPSLSQTVVEEPREVQYEVVEEGTIRKRQKLVSTDGFSYCKKGETKSSIQWRCSLRRKGNICYANVTQHGDIFSRGPAPHTHPADPLMKKKVVLKRDLKREAAGDVHESASLLAKNKLEKVFKNDDCNRPRPETLARIINRARQKLQQKEN